jgi:ABC-type sugar transport system permease subunit
MNGARTGENDIELSEKLMTRQSEITPQPNTAARRRQIDGFPYMLVVPTVIIELLFVAGPLILGTYYSFFRVNFFKLGDFVWFDNYVRVLTSPEFLTAIGVTAIFTVGSLFFTMIVGFSLALALERDSRLNVFARAVVLIPYIIAMLVGSLLLRWIFQREAGILPWILGPFGLGETTILADPQLALAALVYNAVWRDSAFAMILLMAGLKSVPLQLYQAAKIDGAGAFYRFWRITLPLMRIPILITIIRLFIHFTNSVTFALVLTAGGPNDSTLTVGLHNYNLGFVAFRFGQANALAFMVFLFNLFAVWVLVSLFRQRSRT